MSFSLKLSRSMLILFTAIYLTIFTNFRFFNNTAEAFPINYNNIAFLISLFLAFISINCLLISLIAIGKAIKPVLISILLLSSSSAYFMDSYNIIIDEIMIANIFETNKYEFLELLNIKLISYILILGIIPSVIILKSEIIDKPLIPSIYSRLILSFTSLLVPFLIIIIFSSHYTSFIREHKTLRFYANPSFYVISTIIFVDSLLAKEKQEFQTLGLDAFIPLSDEDRELIILVVGETARADHFSLNGYAKETNPLLKNEEVISFKNVLSCGTSTAVSVPCLFSIHEQTSYKSPHADNMDNVLDIINRSGVNVLWLDNNSSSKGVADRIEFVSYKTDENNNKCDDECRDVGMLEGAQNYINNHPSGDILIILHQMGSHGPAYYKRYPMEFEKFKPSCQTSHLENCTIEEISNAYDNSILYTDYFLANIINLLKKNDGFESALLYVSDHGESLGEKGIFLHGLPYAFAPKAQKHVPLIMWFNKNMRNEEIKYEGLKRKVNNNYTHDNLFHTLLGLLEVDVSIYEKEKDIIDHLKDFDDD